MTAVVDWTLTEDDAFSFEMSIELADSIELFELQGITAGASGNSAVFSRIGVGGGKSSDTVPRKSPESQAMANDWCGMVYALKEGIFQGANGVKYRVSDLTLRLPGQYLVADFSADYHRFSYQGRWMDFSLFLFWLKRFTWDVDAETGEAMTTLTFAPATAARAGVTFVYPDAPIPPDTTPTQPPITSPIDPYLISRGIRKLALIGSNGFVATTFDAATPAAAGGPTWTADDLSIGETYGTAVDPWSENYPAGGGVTGGTVDAWVAAHDKIYKLDDIFDAQTLTDLFTLDDDISGGYMARQLDVSIGAQGRVGVATFAGSAGSKFALATDGATFSEATVSSHYQTDTAVGNDQPLLMLPDGRIYVGAYTATAASVLATAAAYVSTDGSSWSNSGKTSGLADHIGNAFHLDARGRFYWTKSGATAADQWLMRDGVNVSPASTEYGARFFMGVRSHPLNPNRVAVIGIKDASVLGVWVSLNDCASWTQIVLDESFSTAYRHCDWADENWLWLWGPARVGAYDVARGVHYDFTGNLGALGVGDVLRIFGGS